MEYLITFFSMGLLVYWVERVSLLQRGSETEIDEVLDNDRVWFRQAIATIRAMFWDFTSAA